MSAQPAGAVVVEETTDIATCRGLRRRVFIDEQGVPEADEIDELDEVAIHLLARVDADPAGTARLLLDGRAGKIGRVCVLRAQRGHGLGRALMLASVGVLRGRGASEARLGAQVSALGFYAGLGFVARGPVFDDAGIPHRTMVRAL